MTSCQPKHRILALDSSNRRSSIVGGHYIRAAVTNARSNERQHVNDERQRANTSRPCACVIGRSIRGFFRRSAFVGLFPFRFGPIHRSPSCSVSLSSPFPLALIVIFVPLPLSTNMPPSSPEWEKALRGELYHAFVPELVAARDRCKQACDTFNKSDDVSRRRMVQLWRE